MNSIMMIRNVFPLVLTGKNPINPVTSLFNIGNKSSAINPSTAAEAEAAGMKIAYS